MASGSIAPWRGAARSLASDPLSLLRREMGELLDDFFGATQGREETFRPPVDVVESDDVLRVTVEIPGVAPGDVEVELEGDVLTLRGEKRREQESRDEQAHCVERSYGRFQRSIRLPCAVDEGGVEARQVNGVLTIVLPKAEKRSRGRRIPVSDGEQQPRAAAAAAGAGGTSSAAVGSAAGGAQAGAAQADPPQADPPQADPPQAGAAQAGAFDRRLPMVEDTSSPAGVGPQAANIGLAAGAPRRVVIGQGDEPGRKRTR